MYLFLLGRIGLVDFKRVEIMVIRVSVVRCLGLIAVKFNMRSHISKRLIHR